MGGSYNRHEAFDGQRGDEEQQYDPADCIVCGDEVTLRCGGCRQPICHFHGPCPNGCDTELLDEGRIADFAVVVGVAQPSNDQERTDVENTKHRCNEWEFGAQLLKRSSTAEIEEALGKALSNLAGTTLHVSVGQLDFGKPGSVFSSANMTLSVSEPLPE